MEEWTDGGDPITMIGPIGNRVIAHLTHKLQEKTGRTTRANPSQVTVSALTIPRRFKYSEITRESESTDRFVTLGERSISFRGSFLHEPSSLQAAGASRDRQERQ
jgi:hypothetical protein